MPKAVSILGAILLAAGSSVLAQPAERSDCAKARDPGACEERRAKMKEAFGKARAACEDQKGAEQRDCMRRQMCAQSPDPARCEARAKERMAQREKAREACKGKQGEELKSCIREQRGTKK